MNSIPKAFAAKTKTLQFRGWRTSIRLEGIFWEVLEMLAKERKSQIGPMIGTLATNFPGGNLSSYLRAACMLTVFERMNTANEGDKTITQGDVIGMLHSSPAAGALISSQSTILDINRAMQELLNLDPKAVIGADLGHYIRLSGGGSFNRYWGALKRTISTHVVRSVLLITPGRIASYQMVSLRIGKNDNTDAMFVVWFTKST